MKIRKIAAAAFAALMFTCAAFAEDESPWTFSITTDFAYYPKSDFVSGKTHFAPITGAYSGIEGRVTGAASYSIPVPMGEHWLVSGATLDLTGKLEVSPVSIKPYFDIGWTPVPFLVFNAGAQIGSGWNIGGIQGMAVLADDGKSYINLKPFETYFFKWYTQGTFQFDTGAIIEGDWTHFQIQYTYQVYYEKLTTLADKTIWEWQSSMNKVNGLQNYQCLILAYQMPLVLSRVGVLTEITGFYKNDVYENLNYNGAFKSISISPLAQLKFDDHNVLSILAGFSSRRSYTTDHNEKIEETPLTYTGYEWFFNRFALSWTYTF